MPSIAACRRSTWLCAIAGSRSLSAWSPICSIAHVTLPRQTAQRFFVVGTFNGTAITAMLTPAGEGEDLKLIFLQHGADPITLPFTFTYRDPEPIVGNQTRGCGTSPASQPLWPLGIALLILAALALRRQPIGT